MSRYRPFADVMAGRIEDHPDKAAVEASRFREEQAIRKADELGLKSQRAFTKFDADKPDFSLIDPDFELELAQLLTFGAKKYAPYNWQLAEPEEAFKRYRAAHRRHMNAWERGESNDPDSGLPHLICAACCAMFLRWFERNA